MMPCAPEVFGAGAVTARRPNPEDLHFVLSLMADPALHRHRPVPVPPDTKEVAAGFARDLDDWQRHGFGRWVVLHGDARVGLCGLTRRSGYPGLNISYHLAPAVWGRGWASDLAAALVDLAEARALAPYLHALVRTANPASIRVLEKLGFRDLGRVTHKGADSLLRVRALGGAAPLVHFGGAGKPDVSETPEGLVYAVPISSSMVDFRVDLTITAADLDILRADPDRAALAFGVLHPMGQSLRGAERQDQMLAALRQVLHATAADLLPWLAARDRACNGAISNLLRLTEGADMAALRQGAWLPLPRTMPA